MNDTNKHFVLTEHNQRSISDISDYYDKIIPRLFKKEHEEEYVFSKSSNEDGKNLKACYYVGIDWLIKGKYSVQVEPKINNALATMCSKLAEINESETDKITIIEKEVEKVAKNEPSKELNYLQMLLDVMSEPKTAQKATHIVNIYWDEPQISITQQQDQLTPFLVVQFLQLLKDIVRKGLKKSYYKQKENLSNRVKGKIMISQQIRQNVLKNQFTQTCCEYQEFGIDNNENRFLKKVLHFTASYVGNNITIFKNNQDQIKGLINYSSPYFENISSEFDLNDDLIKIDNNPFFKDYKETIRIGEYILKKFAYNITKTTDQQISTPPFWIDMPILFELYFYANLLKANREKSAQIHYQFSTYGNALDFLISDTEYAMIIDTKYKLSYKWGQIHEDIRQVSGYARLNKVLKIVNYLDNNHNLRVGNVTLPCLIVYPDMEADDNFGFSLKEIKEKESPISAYYNVYKLGIKLPTINRH